MLRETSDMMTTDVYYLQHLTMLIIADIKDAIRYWRKKTKAN